MPQPKLLCSLGFLLLLALPSGAAEPTKATPDPRAPFPKTKSTSDMQGKAPVPRGPVGPQSKASFLDPAVGAKSTAELVKKLELIYPRRDEPGFLSLVKAPPLARIRLQQKFLRDSNSPQKNFRFETVEQEATRTHIPKENLGQHATIDGKQLQYDLPVEGYITFEMANAQAEPPGKAGKPGLAVGKDKGVYYLMAPSPVKSASTAAPAQAH